MTNTPLPLEARRAVVTMANAELERIQDFCFQTAMDTIADSEIHIPDEVFENEEAMESLIRDYALLIQGQVIARIHLSHMLETTGI